eukprot:6196915-Pleurochrysis_carterae.AAC.1
MRGILNSKAHSQVMNARSKEQHATTYVGPRRLTPSMPVHFSLLPMRYCECSVKKLRDDTTDPTVHICHPGVEGD